MVAIPKAPRKRPPFPYFGGKQAMVRHIAPLLPKHEVYVEVFGGAGSLLFGKAPSALEVYNDIDSDLVNFFAVLRNTPTALIRQLELTPFAREEYEFCHKHLFDEADEVERARRFYVAIAQGIMAKIDKKGWTHSLSTSRIAPDVWANTIDELMDCAMRLRRVQIEHDTSDRIIRAYDAPDVLYYCDPPYVPETRRSGTYRHEMTNDQHRQLLEIITTCRGMVILSGYDCPLYQEYLGDWQHIEIATLANTKAKGDRARVEQTRTESLWVKPNSIIPSQQSLF